MFKSKRSWRPMMKRNDPCHCGSNKKYKKCCMNGDKTKTTASKSPELVELIKKQAWLHGSDSRFDRFVTPPPPKDPYQVPHSSVFFTPDYAYAAGAGKNMAKVAISEKALILDMTHNTVVAERLRVRIANHPVARLTTNCQPEYWLNGWKDGSVMRANIPERNAAAFRLVLESTILKMMESGMSREMAETIAMHNVTRGLIELYCVEAKALGFDGLYGYEVDRHSNKAKVLAQPWLAVWNSAVIGTPTWEDTRTPA